MKYQIEAFGTLPDKEGFAGMFAGVTGGKLFCMGGANFPDKKPWEGGTKVWYDDIYMMQGDNTWIKFHQKMPLCLGYGISIQNKEDILLIGGYNKDGYHNSFYVCRLIGEKLLFVPLASLPTTLANMTGALVNDVVVVAGGTSSATGEPLSVVFGFDLKQPKQGWFQLPTWPGPPRTQAVSISANNQFYLFSGETIGKDISGNAYRKILTDCFAMTLEKQDGAWTGTWNKMQDLPHGVSASASPAPVFKNRYVLFWGGLDSSTARISNPVNHPGFPASVLIYDLNTHASTKSVFNEIPSPVTLPVVKWKEKWLFISGEKKPGIRTNSVSALTFLE